jgi:hypothetical protein
MIRECAPTGQGPGSSGRGADGKLRLRSRVDRHGSPPVDQRQSIRYVIMRVLASGTPLAVTELINFPLRSYTSKRTSVARRDDPFWMRKTNDRLSRDQHKEANGFFSPLARLTSFGLSSLRRWTMIQIGFKSAGRRPPPGPSSSIHTSDRLSGENTGGLFEVTGAILRPLFEEPGPPTKDAIAGTVGMDDPNILQRLWDRLLAGCTAARGRHQPAAVARPVVYKFCGGDRRLDSLQAIDRHAPGLISPYLFYKG